MSYLILFLLVFPKGGFKIGALPITWSYLALGIASLLALFRPIAVNRSRAAALLSLLPFQIISALTLLIYGSDETEYTIALVVNFFFLPIAFYILLGLDDLESFLLQLKMAMLFIAVYGLLLFVYQIVTGGYFEIPFLTTNYSDYGLLYEKSNLRAGGISKLVSTYNNGNIYGLCLLMLLPLYSVSETSKWRRYLVKLSIFLTLSRTIWAGLIIHEVLYAIFVRKNLKVAIARIATALVLISALLYWLGYSSDFIWDGTLGGRAEQFDVMSDLSFIPDKPFDCIHEIVYLGVLSSFGILGLLAYLLAVLSPILLSLSIKSPIAIAIRCGLINYLILSWSDGAVLLIPVMAIYWMLSSLAFYPKTAYLSSRSSEGASYGSSS